MKKILILAVLMASSALTSAADAADLRIYPSFTEVRENVTSKGNTLTIALPQEAWGGIISGSLDLEGLPFYNAIQQLEPNWLSTLEGKTVFWKHADAGAEAVTLIRARDLLVKDAAGKFFNVQYNELQFDVQPPVNPLSPSRVVVFNLSNAGSGTLSYLTRSVGWQPRYTLKASDSGAQLIALADIRNSTSLPYEVKNTELYAGDVNVQNTGQPFSPRLTMVVSGTIGPQGPAGPMGAVQGAGELRGLYKYTLDAAFTLPANSVVTLPFITPKLTSFERYVGLNTYFNTDKQAGTLNRFYRFKADDRLPAGPITVREDGRIVGQTNINDTREGGEINFTLGDDPDVAYTRSAELLNETKNKDGVAIKYSYRVTYTFQSSKTRAIRAEVSEVVGGRKVKLDGVLNKDNGVMKLRVDIPAGGTASQSFVIEVDNS